METRGGFRGVPSHVRVGVGVWPSMCLQTWEIKVDQLETWVERFSVEAAVNKMGLGMLTDLRDDRLSIVNKMGLEMQSAFGVDRPEGGLFGYVVARYIKDSQNLII